jgi:hypothetical protein
VIYVTDSESTDKEGWLTRRRGISKGRPGHKVTASFPDPSPGTATTARRKASRRTLEIYGAEVGPKDVKRYVKK